MIVCRNAHACSSDKVARCRALKILKVGLFSGVASTAGGGAKPAFTRWRAPYVVKAFDQPRDRQCDQTRNQRAETKAERTLAQQRVHAIATAEQGVPTDEQKEQGGQCATNTHQELIAVNFHGPIATVYTVLARTTGLRPASPSPVAHRKPFAPAR